MDLKGVQLSVNDKDLLVDAELRLFAGVHYGLIGRNGVGKSSKFLLERVDNRSA